MNLATWREQVGRHIVHLDFEPLNETPFRASLRPVFDHGGVKIALVAMSAGATIRDRALTKLGAPSYDLLIAQRSAFAVEHLGRQIRLRPGDAVIMQNWEPGRLVGAARTSSYVSIVLPAEAVAASSLAAPAAARAIPRENEVLSLLRGYLRLLEPRRGGAALGALAPQIGRHIFDLALASAGSASEESRSISLPAARAAAALDYIERRFADPDLSVARSAVDLGVSVRYLERLMEASGQSFSRRVLERRLAAAYECLRSGLNPAPRISDIALNCGFSDISHFSRRFRARYGAPPGALRRNGD